MVGLDFVAVVCDSVKVAVGLGGFGGFGGCFG